MDRHYIRLGIIVFGAAIFLPTIFGDDADGWAKWVRDYQTLIAGTAAVIAAAVTVLQMIKSDEKQERRHRQLLFTEVRRELAAADRLYYFFAKNFMFIDIYIQQYLNTKPQNASDWNFEQRTTLYEALDAAFRLADTLDDEIVNKTAETFPANLYMEIVGAKNWLARLREKVPDVDAVYDGYDNTIMEPRGYDKEVDFLLRETQRSVRTVLKAIEDWQGNLRQLYQG